MASRARAKRKGKSTPKPRAKPKPRPAKPKPKPRAKPKPRPAKPKPKPRTTPTPRAKPKPRAKPRAPRESRAQRQARERKNARARERRAELRAELERRAARAQVARERKNARARERRLEARIRREAEEREREIAERVGRIGTVIVNVYAERGARGSFDVPAERDRIGRAVAIAMGAADAQVTGPFSVEIILKRPHTHLGLARKLARIPDDTLSGGPAKASLGAMTLDGEYVPLSRAMQSMEEIKGQSVDEALSHMTKYGAGLLDLPIEADGFMADPIDDDGEDTDA